MKTVLALISDLDGTLAPTEPLWPSIDEAFFSERISPVAWRAWNPFWLQMRAEGRQLDEILDHCIVTHELSHTTPELKQEREAFLLKSYADQLKPFSGASALLEGARAAGFKTAIASGMSPGIIRGTATLFGWNVDAIGSTHEVARNKPDPGVYLLACERLGIDPAHAVAVENEWKGHASAQAAGIKTIFFIPDSPDRERHALEHGIPRSAADLHEVLRKLTA